MLSRRVAVAVIGIPILVGLLYLGNFIFATAVGIISLLALVEFYRLLSEIKIKANVSLGLFFGATMPLIALSYGLKGLIAWLTAVVFLGLLWKVFSGGADLIAVALTLLGIVYIGFFLSYLVLIDELSQGNLLVLFTFMATWVADTSAYGIGSFAGRTPLASKISPNKTVEGLAGAVIINLVLFAFLKWMPILTLGQRLIFALVITLIATLGDLVESALKREVGVKNSGNLIPGHGGFLDRFDSMIFTGTAAYYLIRLFGG